ncbi:MAG: hypothetical protein A4S09_17450 [Proteobacteria bacterium SG_bin7]|nr:MAG: hypothetical protein A4S09_17450 [Proteobacteria bacterium SG_bin7]
MKKLLTVIAMIVSQQAMADGFLCQTVDADLNIKVYNHVQPEDGTRTASVMVFSDPAVGFGNKTIAKLSADEETLSSEGTSYRGQVDLRRLSGGELISGTKLQYVKYIDVNVDFSYANPVAHGTVLRGWMRITKRDGSLISDKLVCKRYLKN